MCFGDFYEWIWDDYSDDYCSNSDSDYCLPDSDSGTCFDLLIIKLLLIDSVIVGDYSIAPTSSSTAQLVYLLSLIC